MSSEKVYYATGRRKTSSARVFLTEGKGEIKVNGRNLDEYLKNPSAREVVLQPLDTINVKGRFDAKVTVKGGGIAGQAGAIRLGISRALLLVDDENRSPLKKAGLLTRDSRKVERKKYGLKGARKSSQFSKR